MTAEFTNLPEVGSFTLGTIAVDMGVQGGISRWLSLPEAFPALANKPADMRLFFSDLVTETDFDLYIKINFSDTAHRFISATNKNFPQAFDINVRMIDGILYLDTRTLKPFMSPDDEAPPADWMAISLIDLVQKANFEDLKFEQDFSSLDEFRTQYAVDPFTFNRVEADRSGTALFRLQFERDKLFGNPKFSDMLDLFNNFNDDPMTDAEKNLVLLFARQMIEELDFHVDYELDEASGRLVNNQVVFYWDVFEAAEAYAANPNLPAPLIIDLGMNMQLSDFNSLSPIETPRDVYMVPLD
jgi:hypothetical protein